MFFSIIIYAKNMPVKIKTLKTISDLYTEKNHVFKDLTLDVALNNIETPGFSTNVPGKDIKVSADGKAVVNSLLNLFNTRPGQRFLFPEYGVKLHKQLFEPATETHAQIVGDAIVAAIDAYEPRVRVRYVKAKVYEDDNAYEFDVYYDVPILNLTTNTGFYIENQNQIFTVLTTGDKKNNL
jgi:phage baseplate assembly protein W